VFALKSLDFLLAFIALIIFLAIATHFVIWFVLERPVYAVLRFKVIRDKKLLRNIILALTVLPNVGSAWAFVIAIVRAF
jgi:type IV secretory pathway VirB3-like protein